MADPNSIASLALRYVASDLALADGAAVSSWAPRKGAGALAQATATAKPTYVASSRVGGRPAVRFDGNSDSLLTASTGVTNLGTAETVVFVMYPGSLTTQQQLFHGSGNVELLINSNGTLQIWVASALNTPTALSAAPHVLAFMADATTSDQIWVDGNVAVTGSAGNPVGSTGSLRVGVYGGGGRYFNGDVAEILGFTTKLTTAEMEIVDSYVQDAYGIPVQDYVPAPPISQLVDDFSFEDSSKWDGYWAGGPTRVTNGQLVVDVRADYWGGLTSKSQYDLTGGSVHARLVQAQPMGNGSTEAYLYLSVDDINSADFLITNGRLVMEKKVANVRSDVANIPFDAETMKALRFREAGGTLFWDTYDGANWTQRASMVLPWSVAAIKVMFSAGYWQTEADGGQVIWDDVNVPLFATVSDALSAAATAGLTVGGVVTAPTAGSVAVAALSGLAVGAVRTQPGSVATRGTPGLAVGPLVTASALLAVRGTPATVLSGTRTQPGVLALAVAPGLAVGGVLERLASLAASAAASMGLQSMPQGDVLTAAVARLAVSGSSSLTAVLAVRGTPVLLAAGTATHSAVLVVRGTPVLTVGQLITHSVVLAARGTPALVLAGTVTRSGLIVVRAVPALDLSNAAILVQIVTSKAVKAVLFDDGRRAAVLIVNRTTAELLGNGRSRAVIVRGSF